MSSVKSTAATYGELAKAIGTTRRTLQSWRGKFGKECPQSRDGSHDVKEWRAFAYKRGLKPAHAWKSATVESPPTTTPPPPVESAATPKVLPAPESASRSLTDYKKEREFELTRRAKRENDVADGKLVAKVEVDYPLGAYFLAVTAALTRWSQVVAPLVFGLPDIYETMRVLKEEADSLLNGLGRARYLEPEFLLAARAAAGLPLVSDEVIANAFEAIGEAIRFDLFRHRSAPPGLPPSEKDNFEISDDYDKTPAPVAPLLASRHMAARACQKDTPRPARPPAGKPVRKRKPRPTPAVSPDRAGAAAAAAPVAKRRQR